MHPLWRDTASRLHTEHPSNILGYGIHFFREFAPRLHVEHPNVSGCPCDRVTSRLQHIQRIRNIFHIFHCQSSVPVTARLPAPPAGDSQGNLRPVVAVLLDCREKTLVLFRTPGRGHDSMDV